MSRLRAAFKTIIVRAALAGLIPYAIATAIVSSRLLRGA